MVIINHINTHPNDGAVPTSAPPYLDVNCDEEINPRDVMLVINALNRDTTPPVISVVLANDTGLLADDRITADPTLVGDIVDQTGVSIAWAALNQGAVVNLELESNADVRVPPQPCPGWF